MLTEIEAGILRGEKSSSGSAYRWLRERGFIDENERPTESGLEALRKYEKPGDVVEEVDGVKVTRAYRDVAISEREPPEGIKPQRADIATAAVADRDPSHYVVRVMPDQYLAGMDVHGKIFVGSLHAGIQVCQTRGQADELARIVKGEVVPVRLEPA